MLKKSLSSRSTYLYKHQFVQQYRHIDEDSKTVPDLCISMRDVYRKYVQTGNVDMLRVKPLVQDDREFDDMPEETVDTLYFAGQLREDAEEQLRRHQQDLSHAASEHKPVASEEASNKEPQAPAIQEDTQVSQISDDE